VASQHGPAWAAIIVENPASGVTPDDCTETAAIDWMQSQRHWSGSQQHSQDGDYLDPRVERLEQSPPPGNVFGKQGLPQGLGQVGERLLADPVPRGQDPQRYACSFLAGVRPAVNAAVKSQATMPTTTIPRPAERI